MICTREESGPLLVEDSAKSLKDSLLHFLLFLFQEEEEEEEEEEVVMHEVSGARREK